MERTRREIRDEQLCVDQEKVCGAAGQGFETWKSLENALLEYNGYMPHFSYAFTLPVNSR